MIITAKPIRIGTSGSNGKFRKEVSSLYDIHKWMSEKSGEMLTVKLKKNQLFSQPKTHAESREQEYAIRHHAKNFRSAGEGLRSSPFTF